MKSLFVFSKSHKGTYDGECPFYCSYSGYNDELMWAATWLYMATRKPAYLKYIQEESISASVTEFNWDLKYAGAQIFLTKLKMGICNQDAVKQLQSMMENEHASENEIDIVLSSYVALKIQKSAA